MAIVSVVDILLIIIIMVIISMQLWPEHVGCQLQQSLGWRSASIECWCNVDSTLINIVDMTLNKCHFNQTCLVQDNEQFKEVLNNNVLMNVS